jgi:hypothetical protein
LLLALALFCTALICSGGSQGVSLKTLLPQPGDWELTEEPETYMPDNLFEYINGAAEIYLSYDFQELIVAQYKKEGDEANISVEIYDMSGTENAFGIYGAERFPDNTFISMGTQGYLDGETLNFLVGQYYVKLMGFECGEMAEKYLRTFGEDITGRVADKGGFPDLLSVFPAEGRVANSEKYSLRNFMGYSFLRNGYMAEYNLDGMEFNCFLINAGSETEAREMVTNYLERKKEQGVTEIKEGFRIKDKYYHNIYISRVDNVVCGAINIKDGSEEVGESYLSKMITRLKK